MSVLIDAEPAATPVVEVELALKLMAEPLRRRILLSLAAEELCVCHLQDDLEVSQTLVSHHLRVLREAGLVESERYGRFVYYRLRPGALAQTHQVLADLLEASNADPRPRRSC